MLNGAFLSDLVAGLLYCSIICESRLDSDDDLAYVYACMEVSLPAASFALLAENLSYAYVCIVTLSCSCKHTCMYACLV